MIVRRPVIPRCAALGLLAACFTAPTARAQSANAAPDTITGLVFDSLSREPLAGAIVVARPHVAGAVADSLGRFVLVSDSLVESIEVHHPSLDVMGLDGIGARRPTAGRSWRDVVLATPSFATVWRVACGGEPPATARGILVGAARIAASANDTSANGTSGDAPSAGGSSTGPVLVAGATVRVAWSGTSPSELSSRATVTDSVGTWALCDVPTATELALIAESAELASGVVRLAEDARRVRRVDLLLGATGDRLGGVLRGRVVDETGFPVEGARVSIDGVPSATALTTRWGDFRLATVPFGSRMLSVQALAHSPVSQVIAVEGRDPSPVTVVLPRVVRLEQVRDGARVAIPVRVRDSVNAERADFEARRRASVRPEASIVANAAELRAARDLAGLLAGVPWVRARQVLSGARAVTAPDGAARRIDLRGPDNCRVHIFVDGRPTSIERLNAVLLGGVAGVEAYASRAVAPPRFAKGASGRDCAIVAAWTERALRP